MDTNLLFFCTICVSFLFCIMPPELTCQLPLFLRPIIGNGFVIGVLVMLFMKHIAFRKKREEK